VRVLDGAARSSLKVTASVVVGLIPLLAFSFISIGHSMTRLRIGIVAGSVLLIVLVLARLSRGMLAWASAVFFGYALVTVVWLANVWAIRHLGLFPGAIFFVASMVTMIMNRPFVDTYARDGVSPEQRRTSGYLGHCFSLTSFWAAVFAVLTLLDAVKLTHPAINAGIYLTAQFGLIVLALAYQVVYVTRIRRAPGAA
jgi:hypothetical protein